MTTREPEAVDEGVIELVESLEPHPAYVSGARWDILHANRAAHLLFADFGRRHGHERNMLWFYLADPRAKALYADWEHEASAQLGAFREDFERHSDDPAFTALLEQIFAATPVAREWWEQGRGVGERRTRLKRVRLADGREVSLRQIALATIDDPDVQVICYLADIDDDGDFDDELNGLEF